MIKTAKNFLLLGSQGMLGAEIWNASLENSNINIIPYARFNADITDKMALKTAINSEIIDGVINTSAFTQVDKCEEKTGFKPAYNTAWETNDAGVKNLVEVCQEKDIPLFHFSTDYVFAGDTNQAFTEDETPNPINEYGKSKAAGEKHVLSYAKGYVLRTAWLAGEYGQSFVNQIVHMSKNRKTIEVIANQWGSPSFCLDVTHSLFSLLDTSELPKDKIFHLVNDGNASRIELVQEIQDFLEIPTEITSVKKFDRPAPRPISSILKNTKLPALPHWKKGLRDLLAKEKEKLDKKRITQAKKQNGADIYRAQQDALKAEKNAEK